MLTKKVVIFLVAIFTVAIVSGVLALTLGTEDNADNELPRTDGNVALIAEPAEIKLEPEHQIHLSLRVANSGSEPVLAWTLDLGKGLYLIKAEPAELFYHKGHAKSLHGNVLVYATPIQSGDIFNLGLTLRVLFDSAGNFDSNPELRLSYARGTKDAQTLAVSDLQRFTDTFVTFPFSTARISITRQ